MNPGSFQLCRLESAAPAQEPETLCAGRIPPAWDREHVLAADGPFTPLRYARADDVAASLQQGPPFRAPRSVAVEGIPPDSDVVALALGNGGGLAAYRMAQPAVLAPRWRICLIALPEAAVTWQQDLSTGALASGLLIDREGRAVVMLQDGRVECFGGEDTMRTHIDALAAEAVQGSEKREEAVNALMGLLENAQGSNSREWVLSALGKAGVDVARPARESGHITRWRLMGPVPWDGRENPLDKVYAGEPDVDVTRPVTLGRKTLAWREYVTELPNGEVDLARIYGSREFEALYAYAEVDLSGYAGQDVFLRIGSNDGYKCWFNGQEAGRFEGGRSYRPGQDSITVRARAGINTVLLKVTQLGGAWGFGVRLTNAEGVPINLAEALR